jgi:hypothetical protein
MIILREPPSRSNSQTGKVIGRGDGVQVQGAVGRTLGLGFGGGAAGELCGNKGFLGIQFIFEGNSKNDASKDLEEDLSELTIEHYLEVIFIA